MKTKAKTTAIPAAECYWLCLEPYVHVAVRKNNALLYDALGGQVLECINDVRISGLIKKLQQGDTLYVTRLSARELAEPRLARFVATLREKFMGDLLPVALSGGKPLQWIPAVKIHKDLFAEEYRANDLLRGENTLNSLTEITLYVNNQASAQARPLPEAYRQFLYPRYAEGARREIGFDLVRRMLGEMRGSSAFRLNIIGGNIFAYSHLAGLFKTLADTPFIKNFCLQAADFEGAGQAASVDFLDQVQSRTRNELTQATVFSASPAPEADALGRCLTRLRRAGFAKLAVVFVTSGEADLEAADRIARQLRLESCKYQPYFNGRNLPWFKRHVFISREQLRATGLSHRDMLVQQKINPLSFGRLTVLEDGRVYANVNARLLGRLGQQSLYDLVDAELKSGASWRRLRSARKPCSGCVYNLICPPPTNYEYVLGKNDLCTIRGAG